jgi:hypothetical protein
MKRLLAILAILGMLSGCATLGIGTDTVTKLCADAKLGLSLSATGLALVPISPELKAYWTKYQAGAQMAYDVACGVKP